MDMWHDEISYKLNMIVFRSYRSELDLCMRDSIYHYEYIDI